MEKKKLKCPYCQKEFNQYGLPSHIWRVHSENGKNFSPRKGQKAWNKGLSKFTDDRVKKRGQKLSENYKTGKTKHGWVGRKHSEETKNKISKSRIAFLEQNPDKVPYKLNHYSKGDSFPEKYFKEVFENENIPVVHHYALSIYELDFADLNNKIDIEIDGEQHYNDKRIVESDKRRNLFLENNGWKIIRIRWSQYQKLNSEEKIQFIKQLKGSVAEWL